VRCVVSSVRDGFLLFFRHSEPGTEIVRYLIPKSILRNTMWVTLNRFGIGSSGGICGIESLLCTVSAWGLLHGYSNLLPSAISWCLLWIPESRDLLFHPAQGRRQHSRVLSRGTHFGYSSHNGEIRSEMDITN